MKDRVQVWMSRDQFMPHRLIELAEFELRRPGVFQDLVANLCDAERNNANWPMEGER